MSKYEIHQMMKYLPSQAGHYTRLEDVLAGLILIVSFIAVILI